MKLFLFPLQEKFGEGERGNITIQLGIQTKISKSVVLNQLHDLNTICLKYDITYMNHGW